MTTSFFQIAVLGDLSTIGKNPSDRKTEKAFFALPILDWWLIFKSQLWGFWVLPITYAYPLSFAILCLAVAPIEPFMRPVPLRDGGAGPSCPV